ncbi:diaminopimelate decarboxylase [Halorussus gelatinilyticus]|uniref:Diaminopimelate decarboxylase n=1 Tax=Halorussus gelatinilyticus TaxID=2937524 RepID=A0A8U0IEB6_9EURY|nr:diaminopimelate decarboxylase [Halorussus gelatinilyticus]UPV99292.1 diaminopimelate decarboxylase [Halorussus gelatinilyticus]
MSGERAPTAENPPVRRLADWSPERLRELADDHGTPLYVFDLDRARQNYRRMAEAFPEADVYYAAKANTARPVLQALADEGAGVECASAGELARALDAGVDGSHVHYTAVNPPDRDLDVAVRLAEEHPGVTITVGAEDTLDRLADRGYDGRICVRVNPGVGAGHHEKVTTGADAKFGVPYERAADLAESAAGAFEVVGIHAHAGSGISGEDLSAHRDLVGRMGELARDVEGRGIDLEFVDVGGGFGVPYSPDEDPLDLEAVAEATREALGETEATLAVEPGRYLVADAGVLLTSANTVKETPSGVVVGVGAGMTTLARPAIYDAHHEIRNVAPGADERPSREVTVAGPVCESGDSLGDHWLPDPQRGDLLAVGNAGAYGYEMASQYNSRPRPASVVSDGDDARLARRRETIADVTAVEPEVDR